MTVVQLPHNAITGLYPGIARSRYEQIAAINVSVLEHFERSAMHAREYMLHPPEPTPSMIFGTAAHCAILEPKRFEVEYAQAPKVNGEKIDRRTKIGRDTWEKFEAAHPGVEILKDDDWIAIQKMREAIYAHPIAKKMLSGIGHNEVAAVWQNKEVDLLCKALIDRISTYDEWTWLIDYKTCDDASRRGFSRACKSLHYGAKAAYYIDGCNEVAPRPRRFAWIAQEKEPPYAVAVYEADDSAIAAGRSKAMRWLREYRRALDTGEWNGYEPNLEPLTDRDTDWSAQ